MEYNYEDLNSSEFDINARRVIWGYKYLDTPYESLNKKERAIIDSYLKSEKEKIRTIELPLYSREAKKTLNTYRKIEKNLEFVTEERIEEMEFSSTHIPKSQILNPK